MKIGQLIKHLKTIGDDVEVGVVRGLEFAPLCEIRVKTMSTRFLGLVDHWEREGGEHVVELEFMSGTEIAMARERETTDAVS